MKKGYDAIFVGCGAPRGRNLEIPGRTEAALNIHIGIDWLASVSFGHIKTIGKRVIVLGGGNTAMDCCRSARRLGGSDVKVIVRSGFEEMKASPWEKEDAMHEGIPIINYHVPKAFVHKNGKLQGMNFEIVKAVYDDKGRRKLVAHRRAGRLLRLRRGAGRGGPGEFLPLDRARQRHRLRRMGPAGAEQGHAAVDGAQRLLRRRCGLRSQEHHHGGGARPRGRGVDRPAVARRGRRGAAAADDQPDVAEDGHPRVELRQRHLQRRALQGAMGQGRAGAGQHQGGGRAGVRRRARPSRRRAAA